ncbi:hypothetical protein P7C71_g2818, partial [Lecanoromycetidae sp. Uapishka_2]
MKTDLGGRWHAFSYNGKRSYVLTAVIGVLVISLLTLSYNRDHISTFGLRAHPDVESDSKSVSPSALAEEPHTPWLIAESDTKSDAPSALAKKPHTPWRIAESDSKSDAPSALAEEPHAPWLIAISTTVSDVQRRMFIRNSFISLYRNSGYFDYVFAMSRPPVEWAQMLEQENKTYGDMLIIDALEDNEWTAKHTKPLELLKLLSQGGWKGRSWDFVSKTDEDSWIYPNGFFEDYLRPMIERRDTHPINRIMMGMPLTYCAKDLSPAGGFETFSWDLVQLLPELRERHGYDSEWEDCQPAIYLEKADVEYNFISIEAERAFDIIKENFHGKTPEIDDLGPVEELTGAVYIHRLKSDEEWLRAAALFDENGFIAKSKDGLSDEDNPE